LFDLDKPLFCETLKVKKSFNTIKLFICKEWKELLFGGNQHPKRSMLQDFELHKESD
jgi:hypothetical protein